MAGSMIVPHELGCLLHFVAAQVVVQVVLADWIVVVMAVVVAIESVAMAYKVVVARSMTVHYDLGYLLHFLAAQEVVQVVFADWIVVVVVVVAETIDLSVFVARCTVVADELGCLVHLLGLHTFFHEYVSENVVAATDSLAMLLHVIVDG